MHGPDCIEMLGGDMDFVREIDFVSWVKAIRKNTGTTVEDFIAIPVNVERLTPGGGEGVEQHYTWMLRPDAALAVVRGIQELLAGPPPPDFHIPGAN